MVCLGEHLRSNNSLPEDVESILAGLGVAVSIQNTRYRILYQNQRHREMTGDHLGKVCYQVYAQRTSICSNCPVNLTFQDGQVHKVEMEKKAAGERFSHLELIASPLKDATGNVIAVVELVRDLSLQKEQERFLRETHSELERRVAERTSKLRLANQQLHQEVKERRILQEELSLKGNELQKVNIALRVLLEQYEEKQYALERKIEGNIRENILPYLHQIECRLLGKQEEAMLSVIRSHLQAITSNFSQRLSSAIIGLTHRELQIAQLVRDGHMNKEIAGLLGVSIGTVKTHRHKIRAKLDIKNRQINLRSYLLSLVAD